MTVPLIIPKVSQNLAFGKENALVIKKNEIRSVLGNLAATHTAIVNLRKHPPTASPHSPDAPQGGLNAPPRGFSHGNL
ncbi:hypothetical protein ELAC_0881 [Estrella lausannensis]|uniref:Uncharacterized protein n=1 Tax=Estrella lausannensis TaxID=483423 RepID=A0A0H5E4R1_9BACT|nr:hypothetical protein ELAC_0881 [Estrella lausannensis]